MPNKGLLPDWYFAAFQASRKSRVQLSTQRTQVF